jgi:hypothetical protein
VNGDAVQPLALLLLLLLMVIGLVMVAEAVFLAARGVRHTAMTPSLAEGAWLCTRCCSSCQCCRLTCMLLLLLIVAVTIQLHVLHTTAAAANRIQLHL